MRFAFWMQIYRYLTRTKISRKNISSNIAKGLKICSLLINSNLNGIIGCLKKCLKIY